MNPQFRQLPPAIIGAAMMTLLAERAELLRGGAAAGHQGSRQRQRWCWCGADERQGLAACVGGAVCVVRRGGGIGDLRLAAQGVAPAAVQVVGLAQEFALLRPVRTTSLHTSSKLVSLAGLNMRTCVARKPDWPDRLLCRAFLQAGIRSGRRRSCCKATAAGHASANRSGRWRWSRAVVRRAVGLLLVLLSTSLSGYLLALCSSFSVAVNARHDLCSPC